MLLSLLRPVRYLIKAVTAERDPKRIALGVALGMLVGLVPKGNLTAGVLAFVLFAIRANLGAGLLTAFAVSAMSPWLDPLTHGIGLRLLSWNIVRNTMGSFHNAPVFPWLALNNTVVLGSLLLGLALVYPTYHLSHRLIEQIGPPIAAMLRRRRGKGIVPAKDSYAHTEPGDNAVGNLSMQNGSGPLEATPSGA